MFQKSSVRTVTMRKVFNLRSYFVQRMYRIREQRARKILFAIDKKWAFVVASAMEEA